LVARHLLSNFDLKAQDIEKNAAIVHVGPGNPTKYHN
jgi:hypothetical protein